MQTPRAKYTPGGLSPGQSHQGRVKETQEQPPKVIPKCFYREDEVVRKRQALQAEKKKEKKNRKCQFGRPPTTLK